MLPCSLLLKLKSFAVALFLLLKVTGVDGSLSISYRNFNYY
jgi:hypothetical protein